MIITRRKGTMKNKKRMLGIVLAVFIIICVSVVLGTLLTENTQALKGAGFDGSNVVVNSDLECFEPGSDC